MNQELWGIALIIPVLIGAVSMGLFTKGLISRQTFRTCFVLVGLTMFVALNLVGGRAPSQFINEDAPDHRHAVMQYEYALIIGLGAMVLTAALGVFSMDSRMKAGAVIR